MVMPNEIRFVEVRRNSGEEYEKLVDNMTW